MRKFAFVVFDIDNSVTERFPVDFITDISGFGWKLKLSTISGDVTDQITKVVQEKQSIKLTINLIERAYEKYNLLSLWLQKYSALGYALALEYDDGVSVRYVEGKVTDLKKGEMDEFKRLSCAAVFTPTTPFFINIENTIEIGYSAVGKSFPFRYPYCYGKVLVSNNEIDNPYLFPVPVTVKLLGPIDNPSIRLLSVDGNEYSRVQFKEMTLMKGQHIVINSAARKIKLFDGAKYIDFTAKTDPEHDTFLYADSGLSVITFNSDSGNLAKLTGSWRQYSL